MSEQSLRDLLKRAVPEPPDLDAATIERRGARERRNRVSVVAAGGAVFAIVAGSFAVGTLGPNNSGQLPPSGQTPSVIPWASTPPGPDPVPPGSVAPPLAGEPIELQLIVDDPARVGEPLRFIVRIANLGSVPVSLDPCPYYRVQYLTTVETGYLNCDQSPGAIPADGHLDFAMQIGSPAVKLGTGGTYDLLWQLGGEGAEGKTVTTPVELARSEVRVTVPSHCGVLSVTVDNQLWLADPPLGDDNPPPGWDENQTSGRWVVIGPNRAEFRGDQGQRASFRKAAPGATDPNDGCE